MIKNYPENREVPNDTDVKLEGECAPEQFSILQARLETAWPECKLSSGSILWGERGVTSGSENRKGIKLILAGRFILFIVTLLSHISEDFCCISDEDDDGWWRWSPLEPDGLWGPFQPQHSVVLQTPVQGAELGGVKARIGL